VSRKTNRTVKTTTVPAIARHRVIDALLILSFCVSLFLLLILATYHSSDPAWTTTGIDNVTLNAGGRVGAWVADILLSAFGYTAYFFPFLFAGLIGFALKNNRDGTRSNKSWWPIKALGFVIFIGSLAGLFSIFMRGGLHVGVPLTAGGVMGHTVAKQMIALFNVYGAVFLLIAFLFTGLTFMYGLTWLTGSKIAMQKMIALLQACRQWCAERRRQPIEVVAGMNAEPVMAPRPIERPREYKPVPPAPKKKAPKIKQKVAEVTADLSRDNKEDIPDLDLLDDPEPIAHADLSKHELEDLSRQVELRLEEFGIEVKVVAVYPGPVVTRFELQLAPGMKVSKITTLSKDLARSLSKRSVRVVEVIPGKAVIGLEIPNEVREMVRLKDVLQSSAYDNVHSNIPLALGKDIAGHSVVVDVAKMPHLLVAGTTGSGKSVSINAMILSILFRATPEQVRFIMIDPKMLELSIYEGIPHLLAPVVTDMKEAANALRWCVVEMDRRYRLMAAMSVRSLASYNEKIKAAIKANKPISDPIFPEDAMGDVPMLEPLPQVVVVVDELADMMMVVGKKVENLIARIAQKARAAGIHMILATQRPSVDVITGLIKANVPTRMAFQVSSRVDSRTILDQQGAEQLLGHGDMLYLPPGTGVPMRVHGAFVADEEVIRVVAAWRKRGAPNYKEEVLAAPSAADASGVPGLESDDEDSEQDALYDRAVAIVTESRRASISSVQRRLKIGYNRAARLIEAMEAAGIVTPMESNGSREVLAPPPPKD
jgi:DNA segregation ATPase FtsK/SpoIIIE, S-DNA-T family